MGDLSKNLSRYEFVCNCGCKDNPTIDAELVLRVQECVDHFTNKLKQDRLIVSVLSGYRCVQHNAYIWGQRNATRRMKGYEEEKPAFNSYHLLGQALDFTIRGIPSHDIYTYLSESYPNRYGVGKYPDRVHFDVRRDSARWESNT
jgi:uncharacterized protein YcbK (DUF882 family)